jgi:RNA polymerase sigma factor (sigma-70 family)
MADADGTLLDFLRRLTPPGGGVPTDAELLGRFAASRDAAAFEALVRRHGPLVWGVCLRLLAEPVDAEDAFQAVFLVLARKAGSIGRRELLANWLYGVALRTARKARGLRARRRRLERQVATMPEPPSPAPPADHWAELGPVFDAELAGLADKYRRPVLLCYLQGHTRQEAAAALGWPPGTVAGRLARALDRLRARLTRRGVAVPAATLAALLAERATAAVPPALVASATSAAPAAALNISAAAASPTAVALAKGTLTAMTAAKFARLFVPVVLVVALVATGAAALSQASAGADPAVATAIGDKQPPKGEAPKGEAPKGEAPKGEAPKGEAPKGQEAKRVTIDEASTLIKTYLVDDRRALPWIEKLSFKEDTPDALWTKLGAQLFRIDQPDGVPITSVFVVRNKTVIPVTGGQPGFRFVSACVGEVAGGGGRPVLAFSHTWGSGELRGEVGILDVRAKEPKALIAPQKLFHDVTHEWHVRVSGKMVRVEGGRVDFGGLEIFEKDGAPALRLKIADDLPEERRKNIRGGGSPEEIKRLIQQLGDAKFNNRDDALKQLLELGPLALPQCREALNSPDVEIRQRVQRIIEQIEKMQKKGANGD